MAIIKINSNLKGDKKMTNDSPSTKTIMDQSKILDANDTISKYLQGMMVESKGELSTLRRKLSSTYWIIIILSIVMFGLGLVLLSIPIVAAFSDKIDLLESLISAGFGIADLAALFLYGPVEKIHNIMGDMSQIILALNSYRCQVGLRLMQMDVQNRVSIGEAADKINTAAENSIKLVQDYFEARKATN